ncbi:uncharacterized protein LOC134681591 [Mytilus trossulus]|uniref:uncharacterized protein LOC134681591 n=1 Tax=Mytilus trossulus TaxID=6551 RepID=UPI00300563EA
MNELLTNLKPKSKLNDKTDLYWTLNGKGSSIPEISRIKYYVKLILLGDSTVGKSSLLRSYCKCSLCSQDLVLQKRLTAIQRCHNKQIQLHDSHVQLRIFDTAGEERYRSITPSYYRGAHGCLLMFDVTKTHTFEHIPLWFQDLQQYALHPENLVIILVGTKCHDNEKREVTREKAEALAEHLDIMYIEISSEKEINISEVFEKLTAKIIETFRKDPKVYSTADITCLIGKQDRRNAQEKDKCSC